MGSPSPLFLLLLFLIWIYLLPWGKKRDIWLLTLLITLCPIKLPSLKAFVSAISSTKIPEEALNHPTTSTGEESYNRRNGGSKVKKNDTWELVTLPRGKRTVGCRWVYTLKHKADGSIERARLVAKGFTQTYGEEVRTQGTMNNSLNWRHRGPTNHSTIGIGRTSK